jgi:hypothetical protein
MRYGQRTVMLDSLLRSAKKSPGSNHLLVEMDGSWEIRYIPRKPKEAVVLFDDAGDIDWSEYRHIEPIKVLRQKGSGEGR